MPAYNPALMHESSVHDALRILFGAAVSWGGRGRRGGGRQRQQAAAAAVTNDALMMDEVPKKRQTALGREQKTTVGTGKHI
jgi:hypothetical protein